MTFMIFFICNVAVFLGGPVKREMNGTLEIMIIDAKNVPDEADIFPLMIRRDGKLYGALSHGVPIADEALAGGYVRKKRTIIISVELGERIAIDSLASALDRIRANSDVGTTTTVYVILKGKRGRGG
jgi:hypothetical protein